MNTTSKKNYILHDYENDHIFRMRLGEEAFKLFNWLQEYGYTADDITLTVDNEETIEFD